MSGCNNTTHSAYISFCKAKLDEVKAANPTVAVGFTSPILFRLWNELSESEKSAYGDPHSSNKHNSNKNNESESEPSLRRSSRLRNKRLGLNFWGTKI